MNFDTIFQEHQSRVYNLALQYVQNTHDAEEITQDVFVKIYLKLKDFRNDSQIATWIYRITINTSLDFLKSKSNKNRRQYHISQDTSESTFSQPNFDHPGVILEQKEEMKILFQALNQLPNNQKTCIILLKIEQLSQKEAATVMDISVKALESLFQRAKKNLTVNINTKKEKYKKIV